MVRYSDGLFAILERLRLWSYNTSRAGAAEYVDPDKVVAADLDGDGKHELVVSSPATVFTLTSRRVRYGRINTVIPDMMLAVDMTRP